MSGGRYHIPVAPAPLPAKAATAPFRIAEGDNYVKYGHPVFEGTEQRGDTHWTAEIITQTWYQAETGRIPISGAGYGGRFAGEGFDDLWLDMSEIVRPTRDGIHGREVISTEVDLGAGLTSLEFGSQGRLLTHLPTWITLPIPVVLDTLPLDLRIPGGLEAVIHAARLLDTLALVDPAALGPADQPSTHWLAPLLRPRSFDVPCLEWEARLVEVEADRHQAAEAQARYPAALIVPRLVLSPESPQSVLDWARSGTRVVHLVADEMARDTVGRTLADAVHQVHTRLVDEAMRDRVTLIVSGGIAAAEHMAKAIACGADLVAIDHVMLAAWGCGLWADRGPCRAEREGVDPAWGSQRLLNLINAWRDQLLEALGAMGMREVRRLRGDIGRTIRHRTEEAEFRRYVGSAVPMARYPYLPTTQGGEGDLRWPPTLLQSSQEQARTGRPPSGSVEYRVGLSGGGFDRVAFAFELEADPAQVPSSDPAGFDLSLPLNRRGDARPAIHLPLPWYGAGMSYGSVSLAVMLARARAAQHLGLFTSTGEGGYPEELVPYADWVITQVATGLFGVREETLLRARLIEIKYAQGAKPGLGGHLLGNKNTASVAQLREAVQGTSLFSPFPFHSVYSVEDHKKHVDWLKQVNPRALISVKVSTPTDVDMVAVGSYYAGAHVLHLDGAYGGTGAAPEIAKKNIAMPIEYAIPKVHRFLTAEGVRDELTVMASGGLRTAWDVAKAIALGADGAILGTAELVAIGCTRVGQCEKGLGCPFGITTTDPELARKIDPAEAWQKIVNLYTAWAWQLAGILQRLGLRSVHQLRGRSDLLVYLES